MTSIADRTNFPRMARVRQHFPNPTVADVQETVVAELEALHLDQRIKPGDTVALTAGSRGIADIAAVLRATVTHLRAIGAEPFIIPAMGSHGGATAEGQVAVLAHYGVTEDAVGCPIRATMDAVQIDALDTGVPVYLDRNAYEADHLGIVNRVKPHTDFHGVVESGLCKMMAIGIGKQIGASYYHKAFLRYGFTEIILGAARKVLGSGRVAFGLAIVENAYDTTAKIVGTLPDELEATERKLIEEARGLMGKLPFDELDCLIVDKMGKNISGTGMDTNIIGRMYQDFHPEPESPSILRILVCDLTDESEGNAAGIGFADVTTKRLLDKVDRVATYMNAFTAQTPRKMRTPVYFDTDREALAWTLNTLGLTPPEKARAVRIKTTLHLEEVLISEALLDEARERSDLEILGPPTEIVFDEDGTLADF